MGTFIKTTGQATTIGATPVATRSLRAIDDHRLGIIQREAAATASESKTGKSAGRCAVTSTKVAMMSSKTGNSSRGPAKDMWSTRTAGWNNGTQTKATLRHPSLRSPVNADRGVGHHYGVHHLRSRSQVKRAEAGHDPSRDAHPLECQPQPIPRKRCERGPDVEESKSTMASCAAEKRNDWGTTARVRKNNRPANQNVALMALATILPSALPNEIAPKPLG